MPATAPPRPRSSPTSVHPELAYLKRTYRAAFVTCFEEAFAALTSRERTLLRLHLVSRLRLEQMAPMFQVNISTVPAGSPALGTACSRRPAKV